MAASTRAYLLPPGKKKKRRRAISMQNPLQMNQKLHLAFLPPDDVEGGSDRRVDIRLRYFLFWHQEPSFLSEDEKDHQVLAGAISGNQTNLVCFHIFYIGNTPSTITEEDLRNVFSPFGELEFFHLQKDDTGHHSALSPLAPFRSSLASGPGPGSSSAGCPQHSRGYGFVQFHNAAQSKEASEKMNGLDLAGRPVRVGLGNDKFTPESTANLMQKFPNGQGHFQRMGVWAKNVKSTLGSMALLGIDIQSLLKLISRLVDPGVDLARNSEKDEDNFETWEKLIAACQALEGGLNRNSSPQALATLRETFDRFLNKFPLLFGYWKKFADLEFTCWPGVAGGLAPEKSNFNRAGGQDNEKGAGASALDDTDVAGVNFNNYSRDALMRKLARTDEPVTAERPTMKPKMDQPPSALPVSIPTQAMASVLVLALDA